MGETGSGASSDFALHDADRNPAFAETADLAAAICGAPLAAVTMLDSEHLFVLGAHGTELTVLPREISLCDVVVREQRAVVVPDLEADATHHEHTSIGYGVRAYAGMPVYDGDGKAVGALCVLDTKARPFSTLQIQALMTLAHQVSLMLALRQRSQELALTTEVLTAAMAQSPVGMVTIAQTGPTAGRMTEANPAYCALLGRSAEELASLSCHDVTHPDDIAADDLLIADLVAGVITSGQRVKRYLRPNGAVIWAELTGTIVHDAQGAPNRIVFHALDATDRMAREAELVSRALQDPLTGLPNRTHLVERLSSLSPDRETVLVFLDLDGVKPVNDRLGHAMGDQVLVRLAERMRGALRSADLLCRVGGDEFVAVLGADLPSARGTAQRLLDVLSEPVVVGESRITLGASAGLAMVTAGEWESALEAADAAMYQAKRSASGLAEAPTHVGAGAGDRDRTGTISLED